MPGTWNRRDFAARKLAQRTIIDFQGGKVYLLPEAESQASQPARQPASRPRERRAQRSATATRGDPDDDPSEPTEAWDTPVGLLAAQVEGAAEQIAQDLTAFGDDLRRYADLLEDARKDIYRRAAALRADMRDRVEGSVRDA